MATEFRSPDLAEAAKKLRALALTGNAEALDILTALHRADEATAVTASLFEAWGRSIETAFGSRGVEGYGATGTATLGEVAPDAG